MIPESVLSPVFLEGDCFEYWAKIPDASVDLILTDPPYNITAASWDKVVDWGRFFSEAWRVLKPKGAVVAFASSKFTIKLANADFKNYRYKWVWDKSFGGSPTGFLNARRRPLGVYEEILVFYHNQCKYNPQRVKTNKGGVEKYNTKDGKPLTSELYRRNLIKTAVSSDDGLRYPVDIISAARVNTRTFPKGASTHIHTNQKPTELLRYLIRTYTDEGDVVFDPFAGSCSCGVSCLREGRRFIGIEKEAAHYSKATAWLKRELERANQGIISSDDNARGEGKEAPWPLIAGIV